MRQLSEETLPHSFQSVIQPMLLKFDRMSIAGTVVKANLQYKYK